MKKKIAVGLALVAITGASLWALTRSNSESATAYRFATIDRGDIESVVSATGTLSAVKTVEVGTQVSGIVSQHARGLQRPGDEGPGDRPHRPDAPRDRRPQRRGQPGAEPGPAQPGRAQLRSGRHPARRADPLGDRLQRGAVQPRERAGGGEGSPGRPGAGPAEPRVRHDLRPGVGDGRGADGGRRARPSPRASPRRSSSRSRRTSRGCRCSPRSTRATSADPGRRRPSASRSRPIPSETFTGIVRQVRLQSTTKENVVNYTVVVDVQNEDGRLLPGMTATVRFVVARVDGVLRVPNAALRIVPSERMKAELGQGPERRGTALLPGRAGPAGARSGPAGSLGRPVHRGGRPSHHRGPSGDRRAQRQRPRGGGREPAAGQHPPAAGRAAPPPGPGF